ncbi:MAG: succinylglutamate desuccinylase/aspartoacylase family protein [Bacteroidota bacterium]|jgi:succinylglutamate desuccinylase
MNRIIGTYEGAARQTLVFAVGAMHGNEPAGVQAIEKLLEMLHEEPTKNPDFKFNGKLVGLIGNLAAFQQGIRYISEDMNRLFSTENIAKIREKALFAPLKASDTGGGHFWEDSDEWNAEEREVNAFLNTIFKEIETYQPQKIVLIDLHTTSADGGIFAIPQDHDAASLALAKSLHAPVVLGLTAGVGGTTLHYFTKQNFDFPTIAVAFESGQHGDPNSMSRAVAALVHLLRAVGCVAAEAVESRHEALLRRYTADLPRLVQLFYVHKIAAHADFAMLPNFKNFQFVEKNQPLARVGNDVVVAPKNCLVLMPLYQKRGNDGFFLVEKIE